MQEPKKYIFDLKLVLDKSLAVNHKIMIIKIIKKYTYCFIWETLKIFKTKWPLYSQIPIDFFQ